MGDLIADHSPFTGVHIAAHITVGSSRVNAEGKAVAYIGSLCSCGHTVDAGGAITVNISE